jgi:hypothetical protein
MILNIFNFASNNYLIMIQRIQTLYLLIADLLIGVLFFVPFAEMMSNQGRSFLFNLSGIVSEAEASGTISQKSWPLFVLTCLIFALVIYIIFQYKNRVRQKQLSYLTIFLLIGLTATIFFSVWKCTNMLGGNYSMKIYAAFPLVAVVFVYLAIRGISKDEHLVKSIDRIR